MQHKLLRGVCGEPEQRLQHAHARCMGRCLCCLAKFLRGHKLQLLNIFQVPFSSTYTAAFLNPYPCFPQIICLLASNHIPACPTLSFDVNGKASAWTLHAAVRRFLSKAGAVCMSLPSFWNSTAHEATTRKHHWLVAVTDVMHSEACSMS